MVRFKWDLDTQYLLYWLVFKLSKNFQAGTIEPNLSNIRNCQVISQVLLIQVKNI